MSDDKLAEIIAKHEAQFDRRPWMSMPRVDRQRYLDRADAALRGLKAEGYELIRRIDLHRPEIADADGVV